MTITAPSDDIQRFYGGAQPGDIPLYSYAAASKYIGAPESTVRWWAQGRRADGYEPVIATHEGGLSFFDLLELHAVNQLRRVHGVKLSTIRDAVRYAKRELGLERPLLHEDLSTFGRDIFIGHLGELIGLSLGGQLAIRQIVDRYLSRLDRDAGRLPVRFYPDFRGVERVEGQKSISISPLVAFGKPTLANTAVRTAVVAARVDAGEPVRTVADDYQVPVEVVESAVLYERAA